MFNRNPTVETTVAYPWAKVFFGFIGGMLLFNFVAHLLGSVKLPGILLGQLLLSQPATRKMDLSLLCCGRYFYFLYCLAVLLPYCFWFGRMKGAISAA